jgi:osmotically-inducible protein OsmY
MITATLTDTDIRVRDTVTRQLDWDPEVDASAVGVAAKDGVVTLAGYIGSYSGKLAAERAAKRVRGVRAVANAIEVRPLLTRTDADIATDVVRALESNGNVPDSVQAVVHHGHVTLTGHVDWLSQKYGAERAAHHIKGVRDVRSYLTVSPRAVVKDVRHRIVEALHRDVDIDARHLVVTVSGDTAILTGTVSTWRERDSAEAATAQAPGIRTIDNRIVVDPRPIEAVDPVC